MLDDLAFAFEAKDVNASSFLAGPIQVTHVYDGKIPVDGNTFHLARNAAGLLDVGNDAVEPIRKKRVVLNVWPGNKTRKQIGSALIRNLVVYNIDRVLVSKDLLNECSRNFTRGCLRETRMNPGQFVDRMRVEAAQQMIDSSAMGLKEIADACGFQTPLAMRRTFLRVLGITAGEYASRFKRSQSQTEMHR